MAAATFHIDPKVLASIEDFDWVIKSMALGHYTGRKLSKKLGSGMEFNQYRPYSQGDDLRQLDWKMYARTDRFYIKQSEIEANVEITFIIDSSKSMLYEEEGLSKLTFAKVLCGVLAFVAYENGDWIGLATDQHTGVKNDGKQWVRFLHHLYDLKETTNFKIPHLESRRNKELFVIVSDLYEEESIMPFIRSLKSAKNEVIVFHLLGNKEKALDFGGTVRMKDLETGETVQLNSVSYASDYREFLTNWLGAVKNELLVNGIDHYETDFTVEVSDVVNEFLNLRKRLL